MVTENENLREIKDKIDSNTRDNSGKKRIVMLDALKGFTLLGILLIHCIYNFQTGLTLKQPVIQTPVLDKLVFFITEFTFSGKAFSLFCFFLGFGYYIQLSSRLKKGYDYAGRFLWRLVILLVFSFIHTGIYRGDILMLYALTAPILILVRKWKNSSVLILSFFLLLVPMDLYRILKLLFIPEANIINFTTLLTRDSIVHAVTHGSLWELMQSNTGLGLIDSWSWYLEEGRIFLAPGLFLLGFYVGRKKILTDRSSGYYWKAFLISVLGIITLFVIRNYLTNSIVSENMKYVVFNFITHIYNTFFASALAFGFIKVWHTRWGSFFLKPLAPYGRMSFTNYIGQSIYGVFGFYYFGLRFAEWSGHATNILFALTFFGLQMIFSYYYLKKHQYGPIEYIWRKLTWIKTPVFIIKLRDIFNRKIQVAD